MPIYEYRCADCGHELEAMQKLSEAPLTDCPACQAGRLRKRISPVAFRLKGSGWYETDFKTGDKKNVSDSGAGEKSNGDDKAPATSNGEAKTDSATGETKSKPRETGGAEKAASGDPKAANGKSAATATAATAATAKSPAVAQDKH